MQISQRAFDLIVSCEVTSRKVYEAKYQRPDWPGGQSGVTVAIGYDLGYCTQAKLRADFGGRVSESMIRVMERCLGVTGDAARDLLPSVRGLIQIPWEVAIAVFADRDVPAWTAKVCKAVPGAEKLPPDCLGALVSLAYNRGDGGFNSTDDRFREMRAIKLYVAGGDLALIPGQIRAMKRLWPDVKGLLDRRDAEAALFADGLASRAAAAVKPAGAPSAPPRVPPDVPPVPPPPAPTSQPVKHGTVIASVIAAVVAALQASRVEMVVGIVALAIVIVAAIYLLWPKKGS